MEPRVTGEDSAESARPPSRVVAGALTLLFGSGVGHEYLGRARRALLWACVPFLVGLCGCLVIARFGVGYRLFVPGVVFALLARGVALLDVFLVPERELRRVPFWHVVLFWAFSVIYAVAMALVIRTHIVQAFKIPSGGMQPTLLGGDHVLVAEHAFPLNLPKRGEIVVFVHPDDARVDYIYRVVALPGDRIAVRDGRPLVNGWAVPHCSISSNVQLPSRGPDGEARVQRGSLELESLGTQSFLVFLDDDHAVNDGKTWTVAAGEVFVLGDNRNNAADSRFWFEGRGGGVPLENLIGRPLFVWLAFNSEGQVDWSRTSLPLDQPQLPSSLSALEPALRACLSARPAQTEPPAPN